MWTLECDGDIFQHKRLWLRPGKKYLVGRVRTEKGGFAVQSKSVSRKHLIIEVVRIEPGDASRIHARSRVLIEDLDTKMGTRVDGEQIRGKTKELKGDEHEMKLGDCPERFHIRWNPVVLSYSFSTKEQKNKDPLAPVRARLDGLDVKAVLPYIVGETTHVVASKRNTAKGLQALVNGKPIVADSFVHAVVEVARPRDPNDPESASALEEDYDGAWPDASKHLPPPGKEPSRRPAKYFMPNSERANIFDGYTFVFCDTIQFENLQAPITNGGGKALMYNLQFGKTSALEMVRFLKDLAGEEGTGEFEDGSRGKGVVLVRFRGKDEMEEWSIELGNEVARALDQRLIEQNEFLDAILINDASVLRRPLPEEDDVGPAQPQPVERTARERTPDRAQPTSQNPVPTSVETTIKVSDTPPKRARRRGPVTTVFKGFDDGFDPLAVPQAVKKFEDVIPSRTAQAEDGNESHAGSQMDIDSHPPDTRNAKATAGRKRPAVPEEEEEDEEAVMDEILPAAAAMKRRRLEEEKMARERGDVGVSMTSPSKPDPVPNKGRTSKTKKPPVNVLGIAREHREAEEEAARLDEEALKAPVDSEEIAQMRNLALIENMPVTVRPKPSGGARDGAMPAGAGHGQWDERWNGRKNFKKFRRPGGPLPTRRGGPTVIVGLEEVRKRSGFGGGGVDDHYWLESGKARNTKDTTRVLVARSQSHSRPTPRDDDDDDDGVEEIIHESINLGADGPPPQQPSSSTTTTTIAGSSSATISHANPPLSRNLRQLHHPTTITTTSSRTRKRPTPSSSSLSHPPLPPTKKPRTTTSTRRTTTKPASSSLFVSQYDDDNDGQGEGQKGIEEDRSSSGSDDDDELKFRFDRCR